MHCCYFCWFYICAAAVAAAGAGGAAAAAVRECMRLKPIGVDFMHRAVQDFAIGQTLVPKGTNLLVANALMAAQVGLKLGCEQACCQHNALQTSCLHSILTALGHCTAVQ
jgi:shikimate 5-dehydrogenase